MNARSEHPASGGNATPGRVHDDTIGTSEAVPPGPACCCPAMPVVRVVMPPTAARPREAELLLCGHHYRVSRKALAAANATVTGLPGIPGSSLAALLSDLHDPGVPVI